MRRRSMIQAAIAAAMLGTLPKTGRGAVKGSTLTALARTLVPSDDWAGAALSGALWGKLAAQESKERERLGINLDKLDKAAGGSFATLPLDNRAKVLAELVKKDKDFAGEFGPLRSMVLNVYFTSEQGMKFAGYRDCTQFEGYPEFLTISGEWE